MLKIFLAPLVGLIIAASAAQGGDQAGPIQQDRTMFTATFENIADEVTFEFVGEFITQHFDEGAEPKRGFEGVVGATQEGKTIHGSVRAAPYPFPRGIVPLRMTQGLLIVAQNQGSLYHITRESDARDIFQRYRVERHTPTGDIIHIANIQTTNDATDVQLTWLVTAMTDESCGCSVCFEQFIYAAILACRPLSYEVDWVCDPQTGFNQCSWTCQGQVPLSQDP